MTRKQNSHQSRSLQLDEIKLWHRIAKTTNPLFGKTLPELPKEEMALAKPNPKPKSIVTKPKVIKKSLPTIWHIESASNHKNVRRGKVQIDDTLDLHGLTQHSAQLRLEGFIHRAVQNNARCVLIITGKGDNKVSNHDIMHAPKGILRERLRDWLGAAQLRQYISGIAQANLKHGGSGAFYVLLRSKEKLK